MINSSILQPLQSIPCLKSCSSKLEVKLDFSFADAFVVATAANASIAQLNGSKDESQMVYGTVELKSPCSCWYVGWGAVRKC